MFVGRFAQLLLLLPDFICTQNAVVHLGKVSTLLSHGLSGRCDASRGPLQLVTSAADRRHNQFPLKTSDNITVALLITE